MRSVTAFLAAPILLLSLAAAPVEKTSRSFDVAGHGKIQLSYPKAWNVSVLHAPGPAELNLPPNIKLESAEGQNFMVEMTPLPSRELHADSMEGLPTASAIRRRAAAQDKASREDPSADMNRRTHSQASSTLLKR